MPAILGDWEERRTWTSAYKRDGLEWTGTPCSDLATHACFEDVYIHSVFELWTVRESENCHVTGTCITSKGDTWPAAKQGRAMLTGDITREKESYT